MTNWNDLATDSRTACYELFERQRWRSAVSRACYAAYSRVTGVLVAHGVTMPAARGNPSHSALPGLIGNNLTALSSGKRWRLADLVHQLYNFRVIADYGPRVLVEEDEARIALGLMRQVFTILQ